MANNLNTKTRYFSAKEERQLEKFLEKYKTSKETKEKPKSAITKQTLSWTLWQRENNCVLERWVEGEKGRDGGMMGIDREIDK